MPAAGTARRSLLLFRDLTDHGFGRQHQRADRGRVLQSRPCHLRYDSAWPLWTVTNIADCGDRPEGELAISIRTDTIAAVLARLDQYKFRL